MIINTADKNGKKLGLMALVRDDGYYIQEWLLFHHFAGVEKFFIMLHLSCPAVIEKIQQLPFSDDIVLYFNNEHHPPNQWCVYPEMIQKHKDDVEWMLICDLDEFVFNPDGRDLKDVLVEFDSIDCGGIVLPCRVFSRIDYIDYPPLPITDHLVYRINDDNGTRFVIKGILRTSAYRDGDVISPHSVQTGTTYILQDGTIKSGAWDSVSVRCDDKIRCHHYMIRSLRDVYTRLKIHQEKPDDYWYNYNVLGDTLYSTFEKDYVEDRAATLYSGKISDYLASIGLDDATKLKLQNREMPQ